MQGKQGNISIRVMYFKFNLLEIFVKLGPMEIAGGSKGKAFTVEGKKEIFNKIFSLSLEVGWAKNLF